MTIAIRVHYSNKRKDVYLATKEEWEEYFEQTFDNTEQLLQKVETWAKAKKATIAQQYDPNQVETLTCVLERRRRKKAEELACLEAQRLREARQPFEDLLNQTTRVQLGELKLIAEVELFHVVYEFDDAANITLDDIDTVKKETGLTARFITLELTAEPHTEYLDEYDPGTPVVDVEHAFKYTYY